ncbi:MAG: energy-coupling factor transporter ATPase [Firmicutes bacterium]|nr:energy-coupling factor transporter ATPase [Bacillota bacterium]
MSSRRGTRTGRAATRASRSWDRAAGTPRRWSVLSSSEVKAPLIEVEGLHYRYPGAHGGGVQALRHVDLRVARGEWLAVVGPNGSGKSTLARMLNGLLLPDRGAVRVAGLSTSDPRHVREIRRRVGLVFQNPDNQIVAPVVEDDVAFGPENLGLPREEIARRVRRALEATGLAELAARAPSQLSGGQKQRLAIAGALAMEPEAVVFDEATSMLDPVGRGDVLRTVAELRRARALTVVWITHDMAEAAFADRVVVLHEGRVAADGPPANVLTRPEDLRRWGLRPPAAVELAERLRAAGVPLDGAAAAAGGHAPGTAAAGGAPPPVHTLEGLVEVLCRLWSSA